MKKNMTLMLAGILCFTNFAIADEFSGGRPVGGPQGFAPARQTQRVGQTTIIREPDDGFNGMNQGERLGARASVDVDVNIGRPRQVVHRDPAPPFNGPARMPRYVGPGPGRGPEFRPGPRYVPYPPRHVGPGPGGGPEFRPGPRYVPYPPRHVGPGPGRGPEFRPERPGVPHLP